MLAYPRRVSTNGELSGQVALVTGGGRGIGAGIARQLADAGAKVAVAALTREQVDEVAREIDGLALELDVTDLAAVERAVDRTESELGPLVLLVANAGIGNVGGATWEIDPQAWWHVLEVNVLGVHFCCRTVVPRMLERGTGRIGSKLTLAPMSKARSRMPRMPYDDRRAEGSNPRPSSRTHSTTAPSPSRPSSSSARVAWA